MSAEDPYMPPATAPLEPLSSSELLDLLDSQEVMKTIGAQAAALLDHLNYVREWSLSKPDQVRTDTPR